MTTPAVPATEPLVQDDQSAKYLATGQLFHALAADKRYRKEVLGLIKKAAPETPIPELDMENLLMQGVEERLKPTTEESKKIMERLDSLDRKLTREKWISENQLTDEEAVEVEELAKKEQIGSSKAALELYRSRQALGTPRGTRKAPPGAEEYLKKLSGVSPRNQKGLKAIAEEEATRIFNMTQRKAS